MAHTALVDQFMTKLQDAEKNADLKPLVALFDEGAKLANLTRHNAKSHGRHEETACQFWSQYLSAFRQVRSVFEKVTDFDNAAVLEWTASGTLHMGLPITCVGVTIFEHDGQKIKSLRTYYDSAAFLPHAATQQKTHSDSVGRPEIMIEASS